MRSCKCEILTRRSAYNNPLCFWSYGDRFFFLVRSLAERPSVSYKSGKRCRMDRPQLAIYKDELNNKITAATNSYTGRMSNISGKPRNIISSNTRRMALALLALTWIRLFFGSLLLGSSPGRSALQSAE